ncbi:NAD(P)H-binding protein [Flavobacterium sp. Sd200]|uniref:NAD(P)H-binding protein n=1 Tax=Flavobacterium sp. Sd200 TaxID=2692211 RepID=UPI00136B21C1|nr:NAD(P)H-binding protein [Flavobacterium sp. Sd200]MXN92705.1 NAD(P)H-binding protein [Flavobacterium sp. Sd200]
MQKTAILLGATGATGSELLQLLLADSRYSTVKLFSRNSMNIAHSKIEEHIINLFELDNYAADFTANEVFCCIGTTKAKTPNEETYRKIDFGIPATAAKLAKANGIDTFVVVSAIGADKNSSIFYNRTKGEMEEAVLAQNIPNTYILQPSLIVADRKDKRIAEKLAIGFMKLLNPLLWGGAAKYKSIHAKTIAKAMVWLANNKYDKGIIASDEIRRLGSV